MEIATAAELIFEARQAGLHISLSPSGRIAADGPRPLIDQYRERIKTNKPALLAYLHQFQQPEPGPRPIGDFTAAVATDAALSRPAGVEVRYQPAEPVKHSDENTVHDCMACIHWEGVETFMIDGRTGTRGVCAAGSRPWRKSNIPSVLAFYEWHFIGECAEQQGGEE